MLIMANKRKKKFQNEFELNTHDYGAIYMITHIPSAKSYIGKSHRHPEVRFAEHLYGYGSISIWNLVCHGATASDFKLEVLARNIPPEERDTMEQYYVALYNTAFPHGLNTGFATPTYIKYNNELLEHLEKGFCVKLLDIDVHNSWVKSKPTELQEFIDLKCKNQTDVNPITFAEMEKWRINRRKGYSAMNTFRTKDMSEFFKGRAENYARIRRKEFTQAELDSQKLNSERVKKVWDSRTPEERVKILKNATAQAAINNRNKDAPKK